MSALPFFAERNGQPEKVWGSIDPKNADPNSQRGYVQASSVFIVLGGVEGIRCKCEAVDDVTLPL